MERLNIFEASEKIVDLLIKCEEESILLLIRYEADVLPAICRIADMLQERVFDNPYINAQQGNLKHNGNILYVKVPSTKCKEILVHHQIISEGCLCSAEYLHLDRLKSKFI